MFLFIENPKMYTFFIIYTFDIIFFLSYYQKYFVDT